MASYLLGPETECSSCYFDFVDALRTLASHSYGQERTNHFLPISVSCELHLFFLSALLHVAK
jgi:hypothetical protein